MIPPIVPRRALRGAGPAIPAPRYRIVERGRRLEVIDTQDGRRLTRPSPEPAGERRDAATPRGLTGRLTLPRQTRFDGSADLTTSRFYDDHGPRLVKLDAVAAQQLGRAKLAALVLLFLHVIAVVWWPLLLPVPLLLLQDGVRKPARGWITRWLDRVATGEL